MIVTRGSPQCCDSSITDVSDLYTITSRERIAYLTVYHPTEYRTHRRCNLHISKMDGLRDWHDFSVACHRTEARTPTWTSFWGVVRSAHDVDGQRLRRTLATTLPCLYIPQIKHSSRNNTHTAIAHTQQAQEALPLRSLSARDLHSLPPRYVLAGDPCIHNGVAALYWSLFSFPEGAQSLERAKPHTTVSPSPSPRTTLALWRECAVTVSYCARARMVLVVRTAEIIRGVK